MKTGVLTVGPVRRQKKEEPGLTVRAGAVSTITPLLAAIAFLADIGTGEAKIVVPPSGSIIEVDEATVNAVGKAMA